MKKYTPVTPGRRHMIGYSFDEITTKKPHKPLTVTLHQRAGRSRTTGRVTVFHQGGGHKRKYRIIDFKQVDKMNIPGVIETVEYDPNRTARIALVLYADGERRYMIVPAGLTVGSEILCAEKTKVKIGNRMKIGNMPEGTKIYNIEFKIGKGAQIARSAGTFATMVSLENKEYAQVKLPSGEVRLIHKECYATIGVVGNSEHANIVIGKAGRNRWKGVRPSVRGKVKNPVDHPHGGGEGRCPIGLKYPKTPWGKHALGVRTRANKRTQSFILSPRKNKK